MKLIDRKIDIEILHTSLGLYLFVPDNLADSVWKYTIYRCEFGDA